MSEDGTDSVAGKKGSVHVPNCKSFLVTEAEKKHIRRRALSATWIRELSSSFLFRARQGAERNSRHSDRNIRGT